MRAVVTTGSGDLKTIDAPVREPGAGEVRITVEAAAINPVDAQTRDGVYHRLGWIDQPDGAGVGWDVAGVVDAVGQGVREWTVGQSVIAIDDALDARSMFERIMALAPKPPAAD